MPSLQVNELLCIPAPAGINWFKDVFVPLCAAFVGGALAMSGSWFTSQQASKQFYDEIRIGKREGVKKCLFALRCEISENIESAKNGVYSHFSVTAWENSRYLIAFLEKNTTQILLHAYIAVGSANIGVAAYLNHGSTHEGKAQELIKKMEGPLNAAKEVMDRIDVDSFAETISSNKLNGVRLD